MIVVQPPGLDTRQAQYSYASSSTKHQM